VKTRPRAVLTAASGAHFVHDGFSESVYIFLPLWAAEFGLSFAQVGIVRTAYSGAMALFQLPAGVLAERWGERRLLVTGTTVTALGFIAAGWAGAFLPLLVILVVAGLGSGVQHPLSSSLVSRAYEAGGRRAALGTYNFSGDLGKVAAAAAVAGVAAAGGWRLAGVGYGLLGLVAAVVILVTLTRLGTGARPEREAVAAPGRRGWGIRDPRGFAALAAVGIIDNGTRSGFLTFLPFVLMAKGASVATVGLAFSLVFAGGATGKFVCGLAAERIGVIRTVVITELATTVGILTVVTTPLPMALAVLPVVGVALNGTSSVLYATVADLVMPDRQSRAYGLYYTLGIGASALAPSLYGLVADLVGPRATVVAVSLVVLVTIPLCVALRAAVTAPAPRPVGSSAG
jgi:FSR family fosmidomycin resistance protein-like MFS transporter